MSQALETPAAIEPVAFGRFERDFQGFSRALGDSFARFGFAFPSALPPKLANNSASALPAASPPRTATANASSSVMSG